ncbi:MAG: hypothetical protein ACXWW9_07050 [Actinomycetota bacterium]
MRRFLLALTALAVTLAVSAPAWANITLKEFVPRRERAAVEKACAFEVVASDRLEQTATSVFTDDLVLLQRTIKGKQISAFDWVNSGSVIEIETVGTTSITRNADGTYTLVQKGSGFWFDDGSLSGRAELVRFTGTVRAVGVYEAKTFTFQPISRTFSGLTAPICTMLEVGLKTRH